MSDQTTESVFSDNTKTSEPTTTPTEPSSPSLPEGLADIIGDGKKYADVNTALKSIPHAQSHIAQIEAENKTLKDAVAALQEDLNARKSVEDLLAQQNSDQTQQNTPATSLSTEDIQSLVQNTLTENSKAEQARSNLATLNATLLQRFGDAEKAKAAVAQKAQELGVSKEYLKAMAEHSPSAVLAYFPEPSQPQEPRNTVDTSRFAPKKPEYDISDKMALWKQVAAEVQAKHQN